ncbi:porin family protein [Sediminibacterium ginsengisoli]|uniref:Outer membrane protein beta-barrel domain-containing protein n=1 Tax=Sediminibacterium ginsengisoli TaxID=413434 RepID=A0A1T4Q0D9_9BACT|nr:porin family protein [Sediminibacterium ginsengisoli]SJZ97199.1 Outer membrane protein beta-barrel domain-containing protein [Sediminibacterium ginsengisoli]
MKKIVMKKAWVMILSVVTSFTAGSLFAQEQQTSYESRPTPKLGVKGGINLTNLYVNDVKNENMKVGGTFGLYAKLPVARGVSIQPEVLYSMKGSQLEYNNVLGSGKYRFNLDYIEIPVTAVFNIAQNFSLHAGGYAAFLTSAKIKDVDNNGNINGVTTLNRENFRGTDFGLVGGVGFDIGNATLGARYSYGLQEIGKDNSLSGQLTRDSKNSAFSFYIGFGF